MKKRLFLFVFFLFSGLNAQENLDALLWNEEITVYSAAKKQQKLQESPYSITVITSEQIKKSGCLSIPEILKSVEGIDYMRTGISTYQVSIRGFNSLISNRILVLVDNRPIYSDFYGSVEWDAIPLLLEEIKQIEIIRGPGSALYGTNAYLGIVNIITKKPEELPVYQTVSRIGNHNVVQFGGLASGIMDNWTYKVSMERFSAHRIQNNHFSSEKSAGLFLQAQSRILQGKIKELSLHNNISFQEAFREFFYLNENEYPPDGLTFQDYQEDYIFTSENIQMISESLKNEYGDLINILQQYYQNDKGTENIKINSQIDYFLNENITFSLIGGYSHYRGDFFNQSRGIEGIGIIDNKIPYFRLGMNIDQFFKKNSYLTCNLSYNRFEIDFNYPAYRSLGDVGTIDEVVSVDLQHDFSFKMNESENHFSYGFQWKRNRTESALFSGGVTYPWENYYNDLWGFFWQSEIVLTPFWKLYYGERYDHREKTGVLGAPRLSSVIIFKHWVFRSSFSHAFRSPSAFESYVNYYDMRGGQLSGFYNESYIQSQNPDLGIEEDSIRNGNSLEAETIMSYEAGIGYRKKIIGNLSFSLNADLYYNKLNDLISYCGLDGYDYDSDEVFYVNMGSAVALGGELSLKLDSKNWSAYVNYSYSDISDDIYTQEEMLAKFPNLNTKTIIPDSLKYAGLEWAENTYEACRLNAKKAGRTPKHKINSGFSFRVKNSTTFSFDYRFVDKIRACYVGMNGIKLTNPAYHLLDFTIAHFWGRFGLTLRIDNVLNNKHYEYPKNVYNFDQLGLKNDFYLMGLEQTQKIGRIITFSFKIDL